MKNIQIHTDGACSGNPGPGGYGSILVFGTVEKEISGGSYETTNNQMELLAVIEALKILKEPCEIELFTDSKYVEQGISTWLEGWIKRGWKTASKEPVKNQDLWKEFLELSKIHKIKTNWVKGHSGEHYNERCDKLAVAQRDFFNLK